MVRYNSTVPPDQDYDYYRFLYPKDFVHPRELDPNYVPPSFGDSLLALCVINMVVVSAAVTARVYVRAWLVRKWGWDDWAVVVAMPGVLGTAVETILGIKYGGVAKHTYDSTKSEIFYNSKFQYVHMHLSALGFLFIRASLINFFLRLAGPILVRTRRTLWALHFVNFVIYPCSILPTALMCFPRVMEVWDINKLIERGNGCLSFRKLSKIRTLTVVLTVIGVFLDFSLLLVPIRMVVKMKMPRRQKYVVVALFGSGFLACAASLVKAYSVNDISRAKHEIEKYDQGWKFGKVTGAVLIEMMFGVISACGPSLKPLFGGRAKAESPDEEKLLENCIIDEERKGLGLAGFGGRGRRKGSGDAGAGTVELAEIDAMTMTTESKNGEEREVFWGGTVRSGLQTGGGTREGVGSGAGAGASAGAGAGAGAGARVMEVAVVREERTGGGEGRLAPIAKLPPLRWSR